MSLIFFLIIPHDNFKTIIYIEIILTIKGITYIAWPYSQYHSSIHFVYFISLRKIEEIIIVEIIKTDNFKVIYVIIYVSDYVSKLMLNN